MARILAAEPLCRACRADGRITLATVCDHIVALSIGGDNQPSNLQPLCVACNQAKSADEGRYIARGYDAADLALDPAMAGWLRKSQPK